MSKGFFYTIETNLERGLFASRWLMAPFYVGLIGALVALLYSFFTELMHLMFRIHTLAPNDAILGALALIDISLAANLLIIVIYSGYENFISKMNIGDHEDRPEWLGTVNFSTLKLKLIASIVAISGIHLLKVFMEIGKYDANEIKWMIIIHIVFIVSGVMLALMDKIASTIKK